MAPGVKGTSCSEVERAGVLCLALKNPILHSAADLGCVNVNNVLFKLCAYVHKLCTQDAKEEAALFSK